MKQMEQAKKTYEQIPIPEELNGRIRQEIQKADFRRKRAVRKRRFVKNGFAAAAALACVFTVAVNTSTAFAETVDSIPVIGTVARVLTFRSYENETEDLKISVEVPSISMIEADFKGLETSVNEEIHQFCQQYADEAVQRAEEYRQAFLDTGGTEEEWAAHNIEIRVWYEVMSQSEDVLSLAVMGTENWSTAYSETRYYNFDLQQGKLLTLKDVLGDNYAETADAQIRSQMKERESSAGVEFWEEDFKGVDENTKFYLNEKGNPVVVFDRYEIAPGAYGEVEFEITAS